MDLFELVGNEFAVEAFKKAYDNNRISHAYIITGPDGIGKSVLAIYMASVILCREENRPCGKCASCIKIKNGNHTDVKVLSSRGKSIGVDDIRDLIDEIYTKPYEGDKKVVIIKDADTVTVQGQNAILKTLEEPSEHTTIIMLAENMNLILETIQSRCQVLRLGRISAEKIKKYLTGQGISPDKASTAANLSDGILGNALMFLDEKFMKLREDVINTGREIVRADALAILKYVDFFLRNKDKINSILDMLTSWYRDIIMLKLIKDRNLLINADHYELLVEESQILSYNKLDSIINIINSSREKINQNVNFQLTIEVMLLNIQEVVK
jgi:DNA polymerase-3 subunit delta'